jgi:excisionase family DNA binding protein
VRPGQEPAGRVRTRHSSAREIFDEIGTVALVDRPARELAGRLTGLSRDLPYDQMRRGRLVYLKVGRRRLITRQHLEQFLTITITATATAQRPSAHSSGSLS